MKQCPSSLGQSCLLSEWPRPALYQQRSKTALNPGGPLLNLPSMHPLLPSHAERVVGGLREEVALNILNLQLIQNYFV